MENFSENIKNKIEEADSLMRKGESSLAVSILKEAIEILPNESYLYYLLGVARLKCGRFFLSKRALEKANNLLPQNPKNLRSLGWAKIMSGELEQGRKDLRESINLDLMNPLAYMDLARSYFDYFEIEEGLKWIERAKALNPNDSFVLQNYKTAEETEKEFSKHSKAELVKLKKEKLEPKAQQEFRFQLLKGLCKRKYVTKDEADEIKEELELNGIKINTNNIGDNFKESEINKATNIAKSTQRIDEKIKDLTKKKLERTGEWEISQVPMSGFNLQSENGEEAIVNLVVYREACFIFNTYICFPEEIDSAAKAFLEAIEKHNIIPAVLLVREKKIIKELQPIAQALNFAIIHPARLKVVPIVLRDMKKTFKQNYGK